MELKRGIYYLYCLVADLWNDYYLQLNSGEYSERDTEAIKATLNDMSKIIKELQEELKNK